MIDKRNLFWKIKGIALTFCIFLSVGVCAEGPLDESLTVIREFLRSKRAAITADVFDTTMDPECVSLKWLARLQTNSQLAVDNQQVWQIFVPSLWDTLQRSKNDSINQLPMPVQEKLFVALIRCYYHPDAMYASSFASDVIFCDFDHRLIDKYSEELMRPFISGPEFSFQQMNAMLACDVPKTIVVRYPDRLKKQFALNRAKIASAQKNQQDISSVFRRFNAIYGESEAQRELISSFLSCSAELDSGVALGLLVADMFAIGTREALIAVLSRFPEETGAPEFDVSGVKPRSPRYQMLLGFKRLYPDDSFFVKYRNNLRDEGSVTMDDEIGGEEGVKKMFEEFRDWAKAKFGYEMDLSKVTYHMNNSYLDDTIE